MGKGDEKGQRKSCHQTPGSDFIITVGGLNLALRFLTASVEQETLWVIEFLLCDLKEKKKKRKNSSSGEIHYYQVLR